MAGLSAGAYSFQDVSASIVGVGGVVVLGDSAGPAKEGITIERSEPKNTMYIGADGTPMHSLHAGKPGTITCRFEKTSPTNALLQAMYDAQSLSSAFWGANVITVNDTARGDATVARGVAFRQFTGVTYAEDANMMEWAFDCGYIDSILG